ncbi:MAG: FISUMP domain-containing protein [Arcobacteraceae bacterium]|nr:FISUMP domain-containing protein [Arcobacteraceae bacterium]
MKKSFLSIGVSVALCGSLYGYDYNIVDGNQMLGAVIDIKDMTVFNDGCVNSVKYTDYQNGGIDLMYYANQTPSGSNDLLKLNQGQGFIVNAVGSCKVNIPDPIIFQGHTYSTVKSSSGKIWLDKNLGATKVCDKKRSEFTSNLDYESSQKDCFGDYYQWGRNADGHQFKTSLTTTTLSKYLITTNATFIFDDNSNTYYDWLSPTATDTTNRDINGDKRSKYWSRFDGTSICPTGFRVPTTDELKKEAENQDNFTSILKIPFNGYRSYYSNTLYSKGVFGSLWTATPSYNYYSDSYAIREDSSNILSGLQRAYGRGIRCIKN